MTNLPKLSARATTSLEVLGDGGSFRYSLERNSYTGREQFKWSLRDAKGYRVHGVGGAAYRELCAAGFRFIREASGFTGISSYYRLNHAA